MVWLVSWLVWFGFARFALDGLVGWFSWLVGWFSWLVGWLVRLGWLVILVCLIVCWINFGLVHFTLA